MKKVNKKRINPLAVDAEFKQTGGSCVLASYALAAHYFTQIPMSKFFDGYCEHFGLLPLAQEETSESVYASHVKIQNFLACSLVLKSLFLSSSILNGVVVAYVDMKWSLKFTIALMFPFSFVQGK